MFYNQMRPQQNPNTQIDPNASRQISNRRMQEILEQARLQQMLKNYNPEQYMNLGLFGNTIGAQTHNPLKGQLSEKEMDVMMTRQQMLQELLQQNIKGRISDRDMQYFSNQMGY